MFLYAILSSFLLPFIKVERKFKIQLKCSDISSNFDVATSVILAGYAFEVFLIFR